ncbi:transposase [Streptomyces sp. TRM66268-LWL]|uniref:Transposase n=1 Tax=Streptomyces polyasparticus TaxID=2767826 RepID=A0ABR7SX54_9ACTN|nr:transposase [Streptomyces polyasparticus]
MLGLDVEIVRRPDEAKGLVSLRRRWIVERSLAWLVNSRRLARDYEYLPVVHEAMMKWAMIRIMAGRVAAAGIRPPTSRPSHRHHGSPTAASPSGRGAAAGCARSAASRPCPAGPGAGAPRSLGSPPARRPSPPARSSGSPEAAAKGRLPDATWETSALPEVPARQPRRPPARPAPPTRPRQATRQRPCHGSDATRTDLPAGWET